VTLTLTVRGKKMTGLHTAVVIETSAVQLTQSYLGGGTDHSHSYIAQNM